ncbi:MAG: ATP-grasp domain-containing protein [Dorea sp.]|nr:ATP-grasp domain-containing protein [Dorea sp.]
MEKLLILGVDSAFVGIISTAKEKGLYTIVSDFYTPEQNPAKLLADEYWMIDVSDLDALEKKVHEEGVTAVMAGNHETCLDNALLLNKRLGFPFYATDYSWEVARDKSLFKQLAEECGLDIAKNYGMIYETDPELVKALEYPVVVKPVDSSSMRGFSVAHSEEEFYKAYEYARSFSATRRVMVEEFLDGLEFLICGYAQNGNIKITICNDTYTNHFYGRDVMAQFLPIRLDYEMSPDFSQKCIHLAEKMQIQNGAFFFQGIRHKGKFCLIEGTARLDGGGLWNICNQLFGFNVVGNLINYARGIEPDSLLEDFDFNLKGRSFAVYGIWTHPGVVKEVHGVEEVATMDGVDIILKRFLPGTKVGLNYNLTQICFYLNLVAKNGKEMAEKFRYINNHLKLINEDGENMCAYMTNYDDIEHA